MASKPIEQHALQQREWKVLKISTYSNEAKAHAHFSYREYFAHDNSCLETTVLPIGANEMIANFKC